MTKQKFNAAHYELIINEIAARIVDLSGGDWSKTDVCILVGKYSDRYGLEDLAGYIKFCKDNPDYGRQKNTTIIHDLMEFNRGSVGFLPRSDGYSKHLKAAA